MRLAVLGTGKMATALVRGWITSNVITPSDLQLYNRTESKAVDLAVALAKGDSTGVVAATPQEAVAGADVVLVAVKPFAMLDSLRVIRDALSPESLVVSVAAGIRLKAMESVLADGQPVIRVMPNTPAAIGAAASAFCRGRAATAEQGMVVKSLLDAVGVCVEVTEEQIDAVIGVSGSGVAYLYLIIEALTDGGVRAGLPRDVARSLAAQTALGAARMVLETGEHPAVLKDAVTTPGGTTITALEVLEHAGVRGTLIKAVLAARDRARELG
jgi:pyrroline-5-carboxylate reductase